MQRSLSAIPVIAITVVCSIHHAAGQASDVLPNRDQVIAHSILANDYWIASNGGETNTLEVNRWDPAAYFTGNQRLSEVLKVDLASEMAKKTTYLNRAIIWSTIHNWERGPEGRTHADAHCCGQTYIDLHRIDSQSVRLHGVDGTTGIKPTIDSVYDEGLTGPNDWHWIDAFYMAGPVFARLDQDIGDASGRDYSNALKTWYLDMRNTKALRHSSADAYEGLWYRDAASKSATTQHGEPEFWGRGNGWVIGGLVRVMDELGPSHPDWSLYRDDLIAMAEALVPLQQTDGLWRTSLADPTDTRWSNPETSATAFITYGMAWGINHGVLDAATYTPVVAKAWNGMVADALHPNGKLGWIQSAGRAPGSTTYDHTEDYGVGAFLLAGAELSLLAFDPPINVDAGIDQSIADSDANGSESVTLDGTATLDPNNKAVSYEWLEGGSVIATGIQATVSFTFGSHTITLRITDDDTNTWEDSLVVTVRDPLPPTPDAGPNQTVSDANMNGTEMVTLDSSGTLDPDGTAASFTWLLAGQPIASGSNVQVSLPLGTHTITLRVTDSDGQTQDDTTVVIVQTAPPSVTASTYQDPNVPDNTLDGDLATRWSAEGTQWIQYDLHMTVQVNKVRMAFYLGDVRNTNLSIDLSLDGVTWASVFNGQSSGNTTQLEDFDFADTPARYVRINGAGNSVSQWNSYTEVVIDWTLSNHDENTNGLPDAWEEIHFGNVLANPNSHHDGDNRNATDEWLWGSDPRTSDQPGELIIEPDGADGIQFRFQSRTADGVGYVGLQRHYSVETSTTLATDSWIPVAGFEDIAGDGSTITGPIPLGAKNRFYRLKASLR